MSADTFRSYFTNNRLTAALVAGLVATHMATVSGYWYRMIGFVNGEGFVTLDWPAFNGLLIRPNAEMFGAEQFWAGTIYHYLTGICFALVYAFLIHPKLPWPNTVKGNLIKALVWALVLALVSAIWWTPSLFPAFNPGFLVLNLGIKTTIGVFLWHLVYGVHLGALYNPTEKSK